MGVRVNRRRGLTVGVIAGALAFLAVIQVRSQAEVARSLENQDTTALAFLIDDLHVANDQLAAQLAATDQRRLDLQRSQASPIPALSTELQKLEIAAGLLPVTGPGILLRADAPLSAIDLQDAANNLRAGGAEAVAINGQRIVLGTVIEQNGGRISIDGSSVHGPWTIAAIGNPGSLQPQAEAMESSLRADPRVKSASYSALATLRIGSIVRQRPLVYGTP